MCIYCGTNKYRKIYEHHYGSIPKENNGRSYEIHHIDGNHTNNNPNNIIAVSLKEHYDIHYSQQDFGACFLLAQKMKLPYNQISELNRLQNLKRIIICYIYNMWYIFILFYYVYLLYDDLIGILLFLGSASIDLFPNALGPHSVLS